MKCKSCGVIVTKGKLSSTEGDLHFRFDDDKEKKALWGLLRWRKSTTLNRSVVVYRCDHCKCLWVPFGRHLV